jgi:hypothetical protein
VGAVSERESFVIFFIIKKKKKKVRFLADTGHGKRRDDPCLPKISTRRAMLQSIVWSSFQCFRRL